MIASARQALASAEGRRGHGCVVQVADDVKPKAPAEKKG
jgi:hypothetical protein